MSRLQKLWAEIRDSLWFLPAVLTAGAIALAPATVRIDELLAARTGEPNGFFFGGGAEGARGVLTVISTGIITVTGVVFSITIVALQLASTQFSPRVLRNFTSDRSNQVVLGIFIATFTYAIMILRAIRSESADVEVFVPALSVTVAEVLALISIGFLIFFINHMAGSIQASMIIDRAARETLEQLDALFPEPAGRPHQPESAGPAVPAVPPAMVEAHEAGYLQAVDEDALFDLAGERRLIVQMEVQIGEFVMPGMPLASVWPPETADADIADGVRKAFILGHQRTPYQDIEFGVIELSDIAVKAMSPSINDPTTATICIDRLAEILLALGGRDFPLRFRAGEGERVRFLARTTTYDRVVAIAFDQIRRYSERDPSVLRRLVEALGRIAGRVPEDRWPPLARQAAAVLRAADRSVADPLELARLRDAARWALRRAEEPSERPAA